MDSLDDKGSCVSAVMRQRGVNLGAFHQNSMLNYENWEYHLIYLHLSRSSPFYQAEHQPNTDVIHQQLNHLAIPSH